MFISSNYLPLPAFPLFVIISLTQNMASFIYLPLPVFHPPQADPHWSPSYTDNMVTFFSTWNIFSVNKLQIQFLTVIILKFLNRKNSNYVSNMTLVIISEFLKMVYDNKQSMPDYFKGNGALFRQIHQCEGARSLYGRPQIWSHILWSFLRWYLYCHNLFIWGDSQIVSIKHWNLIQWYCGYYKLQFPVTPVAWWVPQQLDR